MEEKGETGKPVKKVFLLQAQSRLQLPSAEWLSEQEEATPTTHTRVQMHMNEQLMKQRDALPVFVIVLQFADVSHFCTGVWNTSELFANIFFNAKLN